MLHLFCIEKYVIQDEMICEIIRSAHFPIGGGSITLSEDIL